MRPLPIAPRPRVDAPCDEPWESMRAEGSARLCDRCDRAVHDATHITERELQILWALSGGRLCARLEHDERGAVRFAPPRRGPGAMARVPAIVAAVGLALAPADSPANVVAPTAAPADRDRDGVPDAQDYCPEQPGMASPDPRRHGCPVGVIFFDGPLSVNTSVFFVERSARLDARATATLRELAEALRAAPQLRRIVVEGHTDGRERRALGARDLGAERARAVRDALVALGIAPERLELGTSPREAASAGESAVERAQRRRVGFRVESGR